MECSWRPILRRWAIYLIFPKTSMPKVHSSAKNFSRSRWHFFLSGPVLRLFLEIYWGFISEFCLYYFNSEFWILDLNIWILACKVISKYKNTKINHANVDLVGFLQKEQLLQNHKKKMSKILSDITSWKRGRQRKILLTHFHIQVRVHLRKIY